MSGRLYALAAIRPRKEPAVPVEYEVRQAPESIYTLWINLLDPVANRTTISWKSKTFIQYYHTKIHMHSDQIPLKGTYVTDNSHLFVNYEIFIHNEDMIWMKTIILMFVIMMTMSLFQVPSIQEWLVSQLRTGDLISADPRIISYSEWNNWDNYFSKLYVQMYKILS